MAKKLVYNYTFTPGAAGAGTIVAKGNWKGRSLQLITNITSGEIIFNFADPALGATTTYDSDRRETTITLETNTSAMGASDELQIFVDMEHEEIEVAESLIDPVHKIRVSNPENLIDTDFEYGLQSSKWETIELVNNIPSVYTVNGGISLDSIQSVATIASSYLVTVRTGTPHFLAIGDPIEVQGLTSRTANGKYLVTNIEDDNTFSYKTSQIQSTTGDVNTAYTTILPGTFFAASDIEYDPNESIATDNASPSTLSFTTEYTHGISTSTSLYVTNTVGKKTFGITSTTALAPDSVGFVTTTNNSLYLPSHNLFNNQRLFISPDTTTNPSATLPTLLTGAPAPDTTGDTIKAIYTGAKKGCDTLQGLMRAASPNGESHIFMLYNNTFYPYYVTGYRSLTSKVDGSFERQYLTHGHWSYAYYYLRNSNNSGYQYYYWYTYQEGQSTLYTGQPVDIGQYFIRSTYNSSGGMNQGPASLTGTGHYMINTPYVANSYTPYFISVIQIPDPGSVISGANKSSMYDNWYGSRTNSYSGGRDSYQYQNTAQTLANGWQYRYAAQYMRTNYSAAYKGYLYCKIWIDNSNWTGFLNQNTSWYMYSSNRNWARRGTSSSSTMQGCGYEVEVTIPVDHNGDTTHNRYGTGGSVFDFATMAQTIAQAIADEASYPVWSSQTGINTVFANVINNNRISLVSNATTRNEFGFTDQGTGPINIETDQTSGVVDDYYDITGVTSTTVSINAGVQIAPRVLEFNAITGITTFDSTTYIRMAAGHGLSDGQKVVYNKTSGNDIVGLSNGTTYYAIVEGPYEIGLAASPTDWQAQTSAITSGPATGTGEYNLTVSSIAGRVSAAGTIGITSTTSKVVDGYDTRFTSNYSQGDSFFLAGVGTPTPYIEGTVASVVSDTRLQLEVAPGIVTNTANHYVDTKINVRADGDFLHRPFDGGVEITAGTSPDSSVVRQTRKYFRYQSGKGIQCSVAINFNPARPAQVATGSGSAVTITTEYPHNITVGDKVTISGAEEEITYTPTTASYNSATGHLTITILNHGFNVDEYISLAEESFVWTCAKDGHATNHPYPRNTDPAGRNTRLRIISTTTNTFVVNVGSSTYEGAHNIVSIAANAVTHYDTSNAYNGVHDVTASSDFTFNYTSGGTVRKSPPTGFVEYAINGYVNAGVRCGLFDFQNGFFYEYDGKTLFCVRRSSVQQCAGTVTCSRNSNIITGIDTRFQDQLRVGDMIVLRGQSYKITDIRSNTEIHMQPKYRGSTQNGIIVTKTVDTRIPQYDWNIDVCDGTGPSAFNLDISKIQMAYFDYSWYGAGKIRFGFKDTFGKVKYVHEFIHNNELNEAYMRSGNIAGRYEVFNRGIPSYVPSLFHWGTSVIMDGKFDNDDSYLFTAPGNALSFTNGASTSVNTTGNSFLTYSGWGSNRVWYVILRVAPSDASKFTTGIGLWTADEQLNGETVDRVNSYSSVAYVYIRVATGYNSPAVYPVVTSGTAISIGSPPASSEGSEIVDVSTLIPLISIRLAPSVDNGLIGALGDRDIINRMQLRLKELGISVSHNSTITVVLNGNLSNTSYEGVGTPSLSQYIPHSAGDTIDGGVVIYKFRASGGDPDANGKRNQISSAFDLEGLSDLGNSILGGDGVFPNGPDVMTICATAIDSSEVDATSSYAVSARLSWSESQA